MTATDLPPLERLQAIHLQPGDTLIVTLPNGADRQTCHDVSQLVSTKFPDQNVMVVGAGVTVEVARQAEGKP